MGREFFRLRIGIGHPGHPNDVIDYVLNRPTADEDRQIRESIEQAVDVMPVLLGEGEQHAMTRLHTRSDRDDKDGSAKDETTRQET